MDKILITVHVPSLEKKYDFFLPINEGMDKIINYIQEFIFELTDGLYQKKQNVLLVDFVSGNIINSNNIVKFSGLKNGSDVLLI